MSLGEGFGFIPAMHQLFFGAPATMGAAATTGGLLGGESLLGTGLAGLGALRSAGGDPTTGIPALLAARAMGSMGPTSTVSAGPTDSYGSMADSLAAGGPTMADLARLEEVGGAIPPPAMAAPVPPGTAIPGQVPPITPNPMASAAGAAGDVLKTMMLAPKRPLAPAVSPATRPGQVVPVAVGQPLGRKNSPLERYAMMLRRM